jgi:hypothetical protein
VAFVDPRGTWYSEGEHSLFSSAEARDCFDLIEWAAVQAWSNGKIGMIGQSYFAIMQWKVAALKPPHLTCIAPWGGASDIISDVCNHGGIPETVFWSKFYYLAGYSISGYVEDLGAGVLAHPFRDAYWMDKTQRLEDVEVPAYIVADWSDLMIHTRGTLDAYRRIGSRHKWLEINGRKKWQRFVEPEHADRLRRFYDHFLKGVDSGLAKWPPIRLEVRERYKVGSMYDEREWPLARTRYTKLYLHNDGTAGFTPSAAAQLSYESKDGELQFAFRVDERLELTGYMKLKLWVSSESADDMDLFVAVRKVDGSGNTVHFPFDTIHNNGEAALGCIRVSHRHQDLALSTDYQPRLTHDRELRLQSGEIVAVNIEIYPSSTLFESGSTLQIIVKGSDIVQNSHEQFGVIGHTALRNYGKHTIHVGPSHDSHLLIPLIPPRDGMS